MKNPEVLTCLSSEQAARVESWVTNLEPVINKYPQLKEIDLVIEAGVWRREMAHIARALFPNALWVGTELGAVAKRKITGSIDEVTLQEIVDSNQNPDWEMNGAILNANYLDYSLARDIAEKTGRRKMFQTFLSFTPCPDSVSGRVKESTKNRNERKALLSEDNPYLGQLHILGIGHWNLWGEQTLKGPSWIMDQVSFPDPTQKDILRFEGDAKRNGWLAERMPDGLLLIRAAA